MGNKTNPGSLQPTACSRARTIIFHLLIGFFFLSFQSFLSEGVGFTQASPGFKPFVMFHLNCHKMFLQALLALLRMWRCESRKTSRLLNTAVHPCPQQRRKNSCRRHLFTHQAHQSRVCLAQRISPDHRWRRNPTFYPVKEWCSTQNQSAGMGVHLMSTQNQSTVHTIKSILSNNS